ncbi:hypothetical protein B5X24_HaOG215609 [Helicoverpa armigera]|nr:hypothetical protein B5X24_HaOG215609 [Helicoverpa armigera]
MTAHARVIKTQRAPVPFKLCGHQCTANGAAILPSKPIQVATISNMTQILDGYVECGINEDAVPMRPRTGRLLRK